MIASFLGGFLAGAVHSGTPLLYATLGEVVEERAGIINLGLEGVMGLIYRLGLSQVFIEGGGNYGFLNIKKGSQNGKNNTGAGIVVLGYSRRISHYTLKRKHKAGTNALLRSN